MMELEIKDYAKVKEALKEVKINNLFARAVIENHVEGKVYVNKKDKPTTFYVVHPYGMSLLFGNNNNNNNNNQNFNKAFKNYALNKNKTRNKHEWMQAYPEQWDEELDTLFSDCSIKSFENKTNQTTNIIELNTRINFKFNLEKYTELKKKIRTPENPAIRTTEKEMKSMRGSVIPSNFWNDVNDFLTNGIGFSTYADNELACTAFSAFIMDSFLELGMETIPKYRGKGFAQYTCSKLIDYCLDNDYEPIWACRLENIGSFRLAKKLGFDVSNEIPYYRLSE